MISSNISATNYLPLKFLLLYHIRCVQSIQNHPEALHRLNIVIRSYRVPVTGDTDDFKNFEKGIDKIILQV